MNKGTRTSARRSSLPRMVRGNSNFLLLPYQIKKSVMLLRKQKQVKCKMQTSNVKSAQQKRVLPEQGYLSNPDLEDLDLLQDSFNFSRWGEAGREEKRNEIFPAQRTGGGQPRPGGSSEGDCEQPGELGELTESQGTAQPPPVLRSG